MQEYLVKCGGKWRHFFIKPHYGLCCRRREAGRFLNFEVLFSDACEDFCAAAHGDRMHIICQDKSGSIIYISGDGEVWQKTVLMESKSPVPYPKHFALVPIGNYLNLFYVISYQEKYMLVHQILGAQNQTPTVVDRIHFGEPLFTVAPHIGTDIAVIYQNEAGASGCRIFRWSRKEFGRFTPINPEAEGKVCAMHQEGCGRVRYGAFQTVAGVLNLVCFEKTEEENYTASVMVNLDCQTDAHPVFCREGEKLYLCWREEGCVMSSHAEDDGASWSKPVRYMKGSSVVPMLYTLCEEGKSRQLYGFEKDREIVFYIDVGALDEAEEKKAVHFRPKGYEVEDFAKSLMGEEVEEVSTDNPVSEKLREEILHLKEQYFTIRALLADLTERVESFEQALKQEKRP